MAYHFVSKMPIKRNYAPDMDDRLLALDEAIQSTQAMVSGIPDPGVHLVTFADTDATLGVAGDLWELRIIKASANRYIWDSDNDWWRLLPGNRYPAVGDIPANVHAADGDMAMINGEAVYYNGALWLPPEHQGYLQRAVFAPHPTDAGKIRITGGCYHVDGVGMVYNPGIIDYDFTSLAGSAWSYLYIDAAGLTGTGAITAANIRDSRVAPAQDVEKHGYYDGADRCISFVKGAGGGAHYAYRQQGRTYQHGRITIINNHTGSTGEIAFAVNNPLPAMETLFTFIARDTTGNGYSQIRPGAGLPFVAIIYGGNRFNPFSLSLVLADNEIAMENNNTSVSLYVYRHGLRLPEWL